MHSRKDSQHINIWLVNGRNYRVKRYRLSKKVCRTFVHMVLVVAMFSTSFLQTYNQEDSGYHDRADYRKLQQTFTAQRQKYIDLKTRLQHQVSELGVLMNSIDNLGLLSDSQQAELVQIQSDNVSGDEMGGPEFDCLKDDCSDYPIEATPEKLDVSGMNSEQLLAMASHYNDILQLLPLARPLAQSRMTSGYGYRRSPFTKRMTMHKGMDFAESYGAPVYATAMGEVISVKYHHEFGRMVEIRHNDKVITRFAHLSKANVKVGEQVLLGEQIGAIGSTGRSTGPHLHYEVLINGKQINPSRLIKLGKLIQEIV